MCARVGMKCSSGGVLIERIDGRTEGWQEGRSGVDGRQKGWRH